MDDLEKRLRKKFEGYEFEIDIPDKEIFDPSVEAVEVILSTKDGKRYSMNFITKMYVPYVFDKNKRTGECAKGTYFSTPKMIIVKRMDEEIIKRTIDDYIANHEIESYLTEIV
jgi:hypothetical protein